MKVAVVGAGAVGGLLGARLWAAGAEVTFIDRDEQLEAIRRQGMTLIGEDGSQIHTTAARAAGSAAEAGPHDTVLLGVKAYQITDVAHELHHLCHDETTIVTLQNGLPWWYFHRHGGEHEGRSLRSVDPDGSIGRSIDPARIIGCVVYPAATVVAPGVVKVVEGNRLALGELDGSTTPRVEALSSWLVRAGFKAPIIGDIRNELWLKLWGNLSFNPISALTGATMVDICRFAPTRDLAAEMMREAEAVATKLGVTFRVSIERRLAGAERVGAHKTSMLQDIEAGRPIEIDALVGSVIELGELTDTPTPSIRAVYACACLLAPTGENRGGSVAPASKGDGSRLRSEGSPR